MDNVISFLSKDIFFSKAYASLYLSDEDTIFEFSYVKGTEFIYFLLIKRKIHSVSDALVNEELYDLESPYGYNGPITNSSSASFLEDAFNLFRKRCISERIVCAFLRIHPLNTIYKQNSYFDFFCHERDVVVVDLSKSQEERKSLYSKTTRNIINRKIEGFRFSVDKKEVSTFFDIYNETMSRNNSDEFYYFSRDYFDRLALMSNVDLVSLYLHNKPISLSFFVYGNDICYYHLSANTAESLKCNGNYFLLDYSFELAKIRGYKYMLLGGGRTSSPDDKLFRFKSKFSNTVIPFFIAGIDFIPDAKNYLNRIWSSRNPGVDFSFFQQYRR